MTRKRYVKLLMAHGYSRNKANRCADLALARGGTYRKDYNFRLIGISMAKGLAEVCEAIKKSFGTVADAFRALNEAYRAAMAKEKEPGA